MIRVGIEVFFCGVFEFVSLLELEEFFCWIFGVLVEFIIFDFVWGKSDGLVCFLEVFDSGFVKSKLLMLDESIKFCLLCLVCLLFFLFWVNKRFCDVYFFNKCVWVFSFVLVNIVFGFFLFCFCLSFVFVEMFFVKFLCFFCMVLIIW